MKEDHWSKDDFPRISLIVALSRRADKDDASGGTENYCVLGYENQIPWHQPGDLRHFKTLTLGKPVIMGRKTFESIGNALPQRKNIVVTRDSHWRKEGCEIAHSIEEAINLAGAVEEIMIIGGGKIYEQTLPFAYRLYLTLIHHDFKGDAFFPPWDRNEWEIIQQEKFSADEKNDFDYSFVTLERI